MSRCDELKERHLAKVAAKKAAAEAKRIAEGRRFVSGWAATCYAMEQYEMLAGILPRAVNALIYTGQQTPAPEGISPARWQAMIAHVRRHGFPKKATANDTF
jgi:hypothetical protein